MKQGALRLQDYRRPRELLRSRSSSDSVNDKGKPLRPRAMREEASNRTGTPKWRSNQLQPRKLPLSLQPVLHFSGTTVFILMTAPRDIQQGRLRQESRNFPVLTRIFERKVRISGCPASGVSAKGSLPDILAAGDRRSRAGRYSGWARSKNVHLNKKVY